MSKVKFRLRSKANKKQSIKVYLSFNGEMIETTSGFTIHTKDWSKSSGRPIQNSDENRFLHSELNKLESFLYSEMNKSQTKTEIIDTDWLRTKVKECFTRVSKEDLSLVVNHTQHFIDNAATRKITGGKVGLSTNRIKGLVTFKNKILDYQKHIKKQITFLDLNNTFIENFKRWLMVTKGYKVNYAGKIFDNLKTICLDAHDKEIAIHKHALKIKGFKERAEDRTFVTLDEKELLSIQKHKATSSAKENARKWILLGCEFGQRYSDLIALKQSSFEKRFKPDGAAYYTTNIIQKKTKKLVTVGTDNPYLINIIENDFPYPLSSQRFNDLIKDVCEDAKINEIVYGSKFDSKTNRKVNKHYPKYDLITSHCFRRSFATNYNGKVERTKIMQITGHTKESQFLEYINATVNHEENLVSFFTARKNNETPKANKIKSDHKPSPLRLVK